MGWAPSCVCSQLVAHGLTYLSGGWYQLTSAGGMEMIWPWVSYPPAKQPGFTIKLVMLSRFSRAARRQSPKCTSTFRYSACVIFAVIMLDKASHMTKPTISVGVAWARAQPTRELRALFGKSRQHEIQETAEWDKVIPPGYLYPRPGVNQVQMGTKGQRAWKKDGSLTLLGKVVCVEVIQRGALQSCFQGVGRLGSNVPRKINENKQLLIPGESARILRERKGHYNTLLTQQETIFLHSNNNENTDIKWTKNGYWLYWEEKKGEMV